jgi:hypothetical protein
MDNKLMGQVLCERSSHFTSKQWEMFMEELESKDLYLCIEAASTAKKFTASHMMIPVTNKNDHIKIYSKAEMEQNNLSLSHQIISLVQS